MNRTSSSLLYIIAFATLAISCSTNSKNSIDFSELKATNQDLKSIDFWSSYSINDTVFGTKTIVTLKNGKRLIKTNALPNHSTGTFPNEGNPNTISPQEREYSFPIVPTFTGKAKWAREPGVALNGVKFEPETAERFVCETGEHYRIEAFQNIVDLGLDHNHAHVQPTGAYHYHGSPTELIKLLETEEDLTLIGFAKDGHPIYHSKSEKYKPSYQLSKTPRTGDACSYSNPKETINKVIDQSNPDGTFVSDWEYKEGLGDLDQCNGIEIDGKYIYLVTEDYPYIGRCLMGEFMEEHHHGPPPHGHHPEGERPQGPPPGH